MRRKNIEIKAKCQDLNSIRKLLLEHNADFRGIDIQTDTYFKAKNGLLKLREATLPYEKGLMFYKRSETKSAKISNILVYPAENIDSLKEILQSSLEVVQVVRKKRELYTIDNVKFHLDSITKLGDFIEIEAQDTDGLIEKGTLTRQCNFYQKMLGIQKKDLIAQSYSDLVSKK